MMMSQQTNPSTRLQRFARRLLLASCSILLMGVMGAAAIRVDGQGQGVYPMPQSPMMAAVGAELPADTAVAVEPEPVQESESPELLDEATQARVEIQPQRRTMLMEVTAYCPCELCCGPNAIGVTASGKHVSYNNGKFVAADTRLLPFGTKLIIPGYANGEAVEVIDRGGAIKGMKLDVYFDDHATALVWGRQMVEVIIAD